MKILNGSVVTLPVAMAALLAPQSDASTANSSLGVSATVASACVVSSSPLAFGNYSGSLLDQTATVSVVCTNTTPYTIAFDNGTGAGATSTMREMTGPNSQTLAYGLYTDAAHTTSWAATAGASEVAGTGSGSTQHVSAYGEIPAAQAPAAGAYNDTITVTLTY